MQKKVLKSKINTNGGKIAFLEGVIGKSPKDGGFTDRAIADDYYFEEIVVLADHVFWC